LQISFDRIRLSEEATAKLIRLGGRTGLPRNSLCRIGLCLSLKEPNIPTLEMDSKGQEFNRFLLTGDHDEFYLALLKIRLINDGIYPEEKIYDHFKKHLERGVELLYNKVKYFEDIAHLLSI
jgi:DNA sulfur modification protein DndE